MNDFLVQSAFYVFAVLTVFSGLMVITQNNPVKCVLFLVLTFFFSAALWLMMSAEFLALILVLVYVGAVMTLFLFVVMMLDIDVASLKGHFAKYLPIGLIFVAFFIGLLLLSVPDSWFTTTVERSPAAAVVNSIRHLSNTEEIGLTLYTDYLLAFEVAAVLLLVAIVSAITLAHRVSTRGKRQNITQQIMVRREDRVTLVKMKSE